MMDNRTIYAYPIAVTAILIILSACESPYPRRTPSLEHPAATVDAEALSSLNPTPASYGTPYLGLWGMVIVHGGGFQPRETLQVAVVTRGGLVVSPADQTAMTTIPSGTFEISTTLHALYRDECVAVVRRADGTELRSNTVPC